MMSKRHCSGTSAQRQSERATTRFNMANALCWAPFQG